MNKIFIILVVQNQIITNKSEFLDLKRYDGTDMSAMP